MTINDLRNAFLTRPGWDSNWAEDRYKKDLFQLHTTLMEIPIENIRLYGYDESVVATHITKARQPYYKIELKNTQEDSIFEQIKNHPETAGFELLFIINFDPKIYPGLVLSEQQQAEKKKQAEEKKQAFTLVMHGLSGKYDEIPMRQWQTVHEVLVG